MTVALCDGQAWAALLPAGGQLTVTAAKAGAGLAFFAWAAADPFEQVSDAYTFMELRRVHPRVEDCLFSTLRRPLLALLRDDAAPGIDLLRHDAWVARERAVRSVPLAAASAGLAHPRAADMPFALNIFARTLITADRLLVPQPAPSYPGAVVAMRAGADLVVAAIAAGGSDREASVVLDIGPADQRQAARPGD